MFSIFAMIFLSVILQTRIQCILVTKYNIEDSWNSGYELFFGVPTKRRKTRYGPKLGQQKLVICVLSSTMICEKINDF